MKKQILALIGMFLVHTAINACLNTISNNTLNTYKIVNITSANQDDKKLIYLPDEYLKDETKAHTILPGEECAFGGHYVPTFMIYKQYSDGRWHAILLVKQTRCGPRGPENKYLLMTDLLNRDLPGDYKDVYKFTLKKEPGEIEVASTNTKALTTVKNQYQVILNLIDDLTQKVQELMSQQMREEQKCEAQVKAAEQAVAQKVPLKPAENKDAIQADDDMDGKSCDMCSME